MTENASESLIHLLNQEITPFSLDDSNSYQQLGKKIGDARLVLLGEATHGTEEFYQARAALSQYLIKEKNFHAIAIEGDWTSCYPVNNYLQGSNKITDAELSLSEFKRFPAWMWRNNIIPGLLQWIRNYNEKENAAVGFYGLDLYSLNASMQAVIDYLKKHYPDAAKKAAARYACFDHTAKDPQTYGYLIDSHSKKACAHEVTEQFLDMQQLAFEKFHEEGISDADALFYATQNARVVKNAEHYYRGMFESHEMTWNIRDQHMAETLQNLISHLETKLNTPAKIIVWAHNSHVGDARATEMAERKEINLGQLVREQFGATSFHLGFSTHYGTVTAADDWGFDPKTKEIVEGLTGSYEAIFHALKYKNFLLDLHLGEHIKHLLQLPRLQRAIGVIYRPETERQSHYFFTRLPHQFDSIIHIDTTKALIPLDTSK